MQLINWQRFLFNAELSNANLMFTPGCLPAEYICVKGDTVDSEKYKHINDCILFVVLEASDGAVNHSVAICQNFIFDPNLHYALKYDEKSLDWCCSSDDVQVHFVKFHRAVYFYPKMRTRKFIESLVCFYPNEIN